MTEYELEGELKSHDHLFALEALMEDWVRERTKILMDVYEIHDNAPATRDQIFNLFKGAGQAASSFYLDALRDV